MDAIFFDLDGTLTDSRLGITRSIQHALRALNHPVPDAQDLLWCIGPPMSESLCKLLGGEAEVEAAAALYRARYAETGLFENAPYEGITDVLAGLKAAGVDLYVATSKPKVFADKIIDHFALRPFFPQVFGAAPDGGHGSKSEILGGAVAQLGLDARRCVMVGDRSFDMRGASALAMTAVGVLYGFGSAEELRSSGAHHLCATPRELGALLLSLHEQSQP